MTHQQSPGRHAPEAGHDHTAELQDALDFVNTLSSTRPVPREALTDFGAAVHWLADHDLLHPEMVEDELRRHEQGHHPTEPELRRIRRVRMALRELLDAETGFRYRSAPLPQELRRVSLEAAKGECAADTAAA
jgi:hypothetical protein